MLAKVVLGVMLVAVALLPALALDEGEIATLTALNASFPDLLHVNVLDEYDSDYTHYGASWNSKSLRDVCNGSAGWDIHGIYCGSTGHIEKLRFSNSWGDLVGILPLLELPHLKEFANIQTPANLRLLFESACAQLLSSLSLGTLAGLEVLNIPRWASDVESGPSFPVAIVSQLQSLRNLTLFLPANVTAFPIHHLSRLEYVKFPTGGGFPDFSFLMGSSATLRELYMSHVAVDRLDTMVNFTVLHTAEFRAGRYWNATMQLPPSLVSLTVLYWPAGPFTLISDTLQLLRLDAPLFDGFTDISLPSSIQSLYITGMTNTMTWPSTLPHNLQSLTLGSPGNEVANFVPGLFDECPDFHTLVISNADMRILGANFPNFTSTSLAKLVLDTVRLSSAEIICRMPPASLKHLNLDSSPFGRFPDCISQYTGLETLSLLNSFSTASVSFPEIFENITAPNLLELMFDSGPFNGQNPDWPALIAQFPNLQKIHFGALSANIATPFPLDALMSLTDLRYLSLRGTRLNGTLSTDWFTKHPKLVHLDLNGNLLSGPIPTAGWSKLQHVDLASNLFTDFPYIEWPGAPEMELLYLHANKLTSIPSDSVFGAMTKLKTLWVSSNPTLGGALPLFWTHETSKLENFNGGFSSFNGSIPSIGSPFTRQVAIDHNPELCGPLPEVSRNMALQHFDLSGTLLQGSIPTSWSSHLTILSSVVLRSTYLQGTLPNPLFAPPTRLFALYLDFSNTFFSGPFVDLTGYKNLKYLYFSGPNLRMDACAVDPTPEVSPTACTIPLNFGCECATYYQWCNRGDTACPPAPMEFEPGTITPFANAVIPSTFDCATPPPRQEPPPPPPSNPPVSAPTVSTCPLPSPGEGFICEDGIWHAPGPVVQPNLIVPPGGVVQIDGNLTITEGGIVFNGLDSMVVVNGCIFLGSNEVEIELTPQEIEKLSKEGKLSKTLLTSLGENNCLGATDLSGTKIVSTKGAGSKGCRKLKTSNEGSTRSSLHVVFRIDNTNCNIAIILPSVLVGVALITAATAIIGYQLYKRKFKSTVRA